MRSEAELSDCGRFRFTCTRSWDERPKLLVVMCNPSHGDALVNDQTITLLCHIASHNGYGGIRIVNVCPLRTPAPKRAIQMAAATVRETAEHAAAWLHNEDVIDHEFAHAGAVLIAWGSMGGSFGDAMAAMLERVRNLPPSSPVFCLGKTANGHPKHPMARGKHKVSKTAALLLWRTA